NAGRNGDAPDDPLDRVGSLVRALARRRLTQGDRAELAAALARLEALVTGGTGGTTGAGGTGALDDGYLVTDRHGVILEANPAAAALLQSRVESLVGKPLPMYLAERHWPAVYGLLNQVRHVAGTVQDWRVGLRRAKGGEAALSLTMLPVTEHDHS